MAKRWSKGKSGQQQSKQRRKAAGSGSGSAEGAGGTMGGIRRGMRAVAGSGSKKGPRSKAQRIFDIALWVALAVAVAFFVSRQCT